MNLSQLKTALGISNTAYDVQLQAYLDYILIYLGQLLSLDFSLFGTVAFRVFKHSFMLSRTVPIEAWTNITKVEVSAKTPILEWREIFEYSQFEKYESLTLAKTFTRINSFNNYSFENKLIRVSGTYGVSQNNLASIPTPIQQLIIESGRQYLNFIKAKGQTIQSERSGNLSVSYGLPDEILSGLNILDPKTNSAMVYIIENYSILKFPYL